MVNMNMMSLVPSPSSSPPPLYIHNPHLSHTHTQYKAAIAVQYGGVCCVCKFGAWTCLSGPCDLMEGERIAVAVGDRVIISRWKSKWFYGDRVLSEGQFGLPLMRPFICTYCHVHVLCVACCVSLFVFRKCCLSHTAHLVLCQEVCFCLCTMLQPFRQSFNWIVMYM